VKVDHRNSSPLVFSWAVQKQATLQTGACLQCAVASAFATGTVMAFRSSQPFLDSTISVWHVIDIALGGGRRN
jgi:hypothetical protein